jgi:cytochrome c oxidase subunit 2
VTFFPEAAGPAAREVDRLALAVLGVDAVLAGGIALAVLVFCVRYREGSRADRTPTSSRVQTAVELAWIAGPTALGLFLFAWGAAVFLRLRRPPPDALEIRAVGKQWMWQFEHPGGRRELGELHVPADRPVRLAMTSQDVIHSLYLPEFRVKQDVLPDRVTTLWFQADHAGEYQLACTQYCGTAHAEMRGRVVVLSPADYERWLDEPSAERAPRTAAARGAELFERHACASCHLRAGGKGPPLERIFGRAVRLADGRIVRADDAYLKESILAPGAKVVEGYADLMPAFQGRLTRSELSDLLEYLRGVGRGREDAP